MAPCGIAHLLVNTKQTEAVLAETVVVGFCIDRGLGTGDLDLATELARGREIVGVDAETDSLGKLQKFEGPGRLDDDGLVAGVGTTGGHDGLEQKVR